MSLESSVVDVLKNTPVGSISFMIDTISVNENNMAAVGAAIEKGDIAVEVASTGPQLSAAYSSYVTRRWDAGEKKLTGKITLGSASVADSGVGKSSIFHESVHAMMDVKGWKLSTHNDEVVAYVAQALYLKMTSTGVSGGAAEMAIFNAAFKIVAAKKMETKLGVTLAWTDCDALRDAIKAHPAYQ